MEVSINNVIIRSWTEYINHKFSDESFYTIVKEEDGTYLVRSKTNNTSIWFDIVDEWNLNDCQYYNTDCRGWSGDSTLINYTDGLLNQDNFNRINKFLETPVKNGWISMDYYFGNIFFKSKTYFDKDLNSNPFVCIASKFGCLSIIFFPFYWLTGKLMDMELLGEKKQIQVNGIES